MKKIRIFDTTLRDGEQAPGASLHPEEKIRIAIQFAKLAVDVIEPGFPISSPGEFQAVQEISRRLDGVEICGFARAMKEDISSAVRATQDAQLRRLHMFISSSQIQMDYQLRKSQEQVIEMARKSVAYAKAFVERIEFSPMDASRAGEDFLFQLVEAVIAEGATIINIPDTVGYALPEEFGGIFTRLRQQVRGGESVEYSAHCHNDLGLAVANSLAAIRAGATQIEVTINGVGERAGNCSLEELVMAIETRKLTLDAETGIHISEIYETSRMVSRAMRFPIAHNKPLVGRNAFQHEAGIHQDGLLKNRGTYEIMNPEQMGIPRSMIILGKHSGRHALKHRVSELGIELPEAQLDGLFNRFKEAADEHKIVTDDQLARLVGVATDQALERFTLVDLVIDSFSLMDMKTCAEKANGRTVTAVILDQITGQETVAFAKATEPIEAVLNSIRQAVSLNTIIEDVELHAMSGKAEVSVTILVKWSHSDSLLNEMGRSCQKFHETSVDIDVVMAAARAMIAVCNKAARLMRNSQTDGFVSAKP